MTEDTVQDMNRPKRRRRRALLWLLVSVGVFVLLAVIGWVYSVDSIDSQIAAEIARYRAAGEPVDFADFNDPPIPPAENAARLYIDAAKAVRTDMSEQDFRELLGNLTPARMDVARGIVERNAEALALCRRARSLAKADWLRRLGPSGYSPTLPSYTSGVKDLARLMALAAEYYHRTGDDAAAVEDILDTLALADALDQTPDYIDHLVSIGITDLAVSTTEDIIPRLAVAPGAGGAPADKEQIRALISKLLEEQARIRRLKRIYYAERARYAYWATHMGPAGRDVLGTLLSLVTTPLFKRGSLRTMRMYTAAGKAVEQDSFSAAAEAMPRADMIDRLARPLGADLLGIMAGSVQRGLAREYRSRPVRRMAAVALAMKLYEADHGRAIEKLADLVPEYLPAVPNDPFDPSGGPIRYAPTARWPVLYSLGPNGTDEGGAHAADLESYKRSPDKFDLVFFLTDQRPVRPPVALSSEQAATSEPASQASLPATSPSAP